MFLYSLIGSFILLVVTNLLALRKDGRLIIFGLVWMSWPLFWFGWLLPLHCLLLSVAALLNLWVKKPGSFFPWSVAATVLAYGFILLDVQRYSSLRDEYPLESLDTRLAYETRTQKSPLSETTVPDVENNPPLKQSVEYMEHVLQPRHFLDETWRAEQRIRTLKHVHANHVQQFIDSPGFGFARMPRRTDPKYLPVPEVPPIVLPAPPAYSPEKSKGEDGNTVIGKMEDVRRSDMRMVHVDGVREFFSPMTFVYVRDRQHVAGLLPHHFRQMPPWIPNSVDEVKWRIERLELVSLLRFGEPRVYVSENLPRMDELQEAATRSLDDFERGRLDRLRQGEDIVVRSTTKEIRMLGALRAVRQCVVCHSVRRGELLGAFSYRLRPSLRKLRGG
jgi:hypothetical protein